MSVDNNVFENEVIESVDYVVVNKEHDYFTGVAIKTNKQTMMFLISSEVSCCETFGVQMFYDGKCYDVYENNNQSKGEGGFEPVKALVGQTLKTIKWDHEPTGYDYHSNCAFKIETDKTTFGINIFNEHNGYYPHSYKVKWNAYENSGEL